MTYSSHSVSTEPPINSFGDLCTSSDLDFGLQALDLGVDFLEGAGWGVGVEVAGEGNFVADLGFGGVVPGVGDVGVDFGSEIVINSGLVFESVEPSGGVGLKGDPFDGQ